MTNLYDIVDPNDLASGIKEKLINVRESSDGMRIYNYSDAAMFTPGAWDNPAVRQCRGLIVASDNTIVARAWSKFFNVGQTETGYLDYNAPVEVTDKIDGSLGILHRAENGNLRIATRGSFESDQAIEATRILQEIYPHLNPVNDYTFLFEILLPWNRIVIDYFHDGREYLQQNRWSLSSRTSQNDAREHISSPQRLEDMSSIGGRNGEVRTGLRELSQSSYARHTQGDLVLLGAVHISTGEYIGPGRAGSLLHWTGPMTQTFEYRTLRSALEAQSRTNAEGFCVRFVDEPRIVKIKQEDYVQLHKIVTGLNERSVWEHAMEAKPLEELLAPLPDELHEWTRDVWTRLGTDVQEIENRVIQAHFDIVARLRPEQRGDRKAYALYAKKNRELAGYLFAFLDGKNIRPMILKNIKPSGAVKAVVRSEDVA